MKKLIFIFLALLLIGSLNGQDALQRAYIPKMGINQSAINPQKNAQSALMEAQRQMRLFNFDRTIEAFDNAVMQNPTSAVALLNRALFKKKIGMYSEAIQDVQLANRYNPFAADVYGFNGFDGLMNVLELNPEKSFVNLSPIKRLNYYYEMIDQLLLQEEIDESKFDRLVDLFELKENKDYIEAVSLADSLLGLYPQSAIIYDLLGSSYIELEEYSLAAEALSKAVAIQPNYAMAWYNYSRLEQFVGHLQKAEQYLNKAILLQDGLTKAYFDKALISSKNGNLNEALEHYNLIINLKGVDYWEAIQNRGLTRKLLGDFKGAISDINQAIEYSPENAQLYLSRANVYLILGHEDQAILDYSKAINLDKSIVAARYNRGIAFIRINNMNAACFDFENASDLGFSKAEDFIQYFCTE